MRDIIDTVPLNRDAIRIPLLVGLPIAAVATFAMHGSIYLYLKTEGELQQRIHGWMWKTFRALFLVLYILLRRSSHWSAIAVGHTANFREQSVGVGRRRPQYPRRCEHPASYSPEPVSLRFALQLPCLQSPR